MKALAGLPPFWLLAMLAAGLALGRLLPVSSPGWLRPAGWGLAVAGLALMLAAVARMARARTTVMPGRVPEALVTDGIFGLSRNPIYLGDLLLLAGLLLAWDAATGLVTVPAFALLLTRRFIIPEEAVLAQRFGAAFTDWAGRVRRWI